MNEGSALPPLLRSAEPQLFVADIRATCDYYVSKLGFSVAFTWGDPPFYGQVIRGGARLNLRRVDAPVIDAEARRRDELLSASVTVATRAEIEALATEFVASGAHLHQPLQAKPWGALDLIVEDPDGNLVLFAGPSS